MIMRINRNSFKIRGNSGMERLIRFFALLVVIYIVAVLFWKNSERSMDAINSRGTLHDQTESVNTEVRNYILDFAKLYKQEYGLILKVRVSNEPMDIPERDGKTLFLALNPQEQTVVLQLPPMLEAALGQEFTAMLRQDFFQSYFQEDAWQKGIIMCLGLIAESLQAMNDNMNATPTEETSLQDQPPAPDEPSTQEESPNNE